MRGLNRIGTCPPSELVIQRLDNQELIGAAAAYLEVAMAVQIRQEAAEQAMVPHTLGLSAWPLGLRWEPSNDPLRNLRLARELIDLEIRRLGSEP